MKICPQCHATHPDNLLNCPRDGTALTEHDAWPEGTVVDGKYRVLAMLGRDMVSVAYKSVQIESEQFRTLKVMSPELALDRGFVKLFHEDAVQRKKLCHANLAHVEDVGHAEDGRPFIVMEYVAGQSLRKFIEQEAPFAPLRVCALAKQVAAGLGAAHALGMVHRDIKPENIYVLDGEGPEKIKLLGLGVTRLQDALLGDRFRTAPEAIIGTFQYLSPEQALGQIGGQLDGRADLYALGVLMYQMLTGVLPFHAATAADWMMAHIQETPISIRVAHANLSIPDTLTHLVMQCLSKNRESRPSSASQLIYELENTEGEISSSETCAAAPPESQGRPKSAGWKFWKR